MKNLLIALSAVIVVALLTVGMVIAFVPETHTHEYTSYVEIDPTCTSNGKMVYNCSCGNSYAEKIDALGHSFTNYASDNNATCTADGTLTAKCDRCDVTDSKVDEGSMLPHSYDAIVNNGGDHTKSCACGHSITEAHAFEETARVDATHTATGSVDYACECGATKSETLEMLVGCLYNKEVEDAEYLKSVATCTEAAVYYKSCVCGKTSQEAETFTVGEPNGHSLELWTLKSVDTEAQTAVLSYNCYDCREDVTLNITFADCEKSGTPATCENDGLETVTYVYYIGADKHELVIFSGVITKLGHAYSAPVYTWSEDNTTCTATMTCANDPSHVVSENANVTSEVIAPKCFVGGKTVYTATFTNSAFATQTKNTDETAQLGAHTWNGTTCTVCNATKFEGETANITYTMLEGSSRVVSVGREGKTVEATNYPSGEGFVYFMSSALTTTLKFEVTASAEGKASISVRMGRATYDAYLENLLYVQVNGTKVESYPDIVFPKYSTINYYDWYEIVIADVELQAGNNVIELIKPIPADPANSDNARFGLNLDYMSVIPENPEMVIENTLEKNNGHSYDWTFVTFPTYEAAGSTYGYCKYCRDKQEVDLPVISAENGYTKLSSGVMSRWEYDHNGHKIYVDVPEESQKYMFDVTATDNVFTNVVDNNGIGDGSSLYNTNKKKNSYGYFYELTQESTFTLEVTVDEAAEVVFILGLRSTANTTYKCGEIIKNISVINGGQAISSEIRNDNVTFLGWSPENTVDAELAVLSLQPGKNVITFTMAGLNVNISSVGFGAFVPVKHEPVTVYGGTINTFDPFATANGGSLIDNDTTAGKVHGLVNEGTDNAMYQNLRNSVLSFTVYVEEATTIRLSLGCAYNNTFTTNAIATVTSANANGQANKVTQSSFSTKHTKWTVADAVILELATIELAAGENTITLTMGANNINITGVYVAATKEVVFGKH